MISLISKPDNFESVDINIEVCTLCYKNGDFHFMLPLPLPMYDTFWKFREHIPVLFMNVSEHCTVLGAYSFKSLFADIYICRLYSIV